MTVSLPLPLAREAAGSAFCPGCEATAERREWRRAVLAEIAEVGLVLARARGREALAEHEDQRTAVPPREARGGARGGTKGGDPGLSFIRFAREVRLIVEPSAGLDAGPQAAPHRRKRTPRPPAEPRPQAAPPPPAESPPPAAPREDDFDKVGPRADEPPEDARADDPARPHLRSILRGVVLADPGVAGKASVLLAIDDELEDPGAWDALDQGAAAGLAVQALCSDLGIGFGREAPGALWMTKGPWRAEDPAFRPVRAASGRDPPPGAPGPTSAAASS